jgi:hypothetical protein
MKTRDSFLTLFIGVCGAVALLILGSASAPAQDTSTLGKADNTPASVATSQAASSAALKADTEWDGISCELTSVKRGDGDTITIQFKYTNNGSKKTSISYTQIGGNNAAEEAYYVDPKNKKKYTVIKDAENKAVASNMTHLDLDAGASRSGWTKLPAPPVDVTKITVYIPGAPPFESVPLAP